MKVKIRMVASEDQKTVTYDLGTIGVEEDEWQKMTDEEKKSVLIDVADSESEQPFWCVDDYEELKS